MVLTKEMKQERLQLLCKAYMALNGRGTAKQVFEFIETNNFGFKVSYYQVVDFLRNNVYSKSKAHRNCLKNCYSFTQKGNKARVYYIRE